MSPDLKECEALWVEEAERRYLAYKKGRISARPAEDAISEVRSRINRHLNRKDAKTQSDFSGTQGSRSNKSDIMPPHAWPVSRRAPADI